MGERAEGESENTKSVSPRQRKRKVRPTRVEGMTSLELLVKMLLLAVVCDSNRLLDRRQPLVRGHLPAPEELVEVVASDGAVVELAGGVDNEAEGAGPDEVGSDRGGGGGGGKRGGGDEGVGGEGEGPVEEGRLLICDGRVVWRVEHLKNGHHPTEVLRLCEHLEGPAHLLLSHRPHLRSNVPARIHLRSRQLEVESINRAHGGHEDPPVPRLEHDSEERLEHGVLLLRVRLNLQQHRRRLADQRFRRNPPDSLASDLLMHLHPPLHRHKHTGTQTRTRRPPKLQHLVPRLAHSGRILERNVLPQAREEVSHRRLPSRLLDPQPHQIGLGPERSGTGRAAIHVEVVSVRRDVERGEEGMERDGRERVSRSLDVELGE